MRKTIIAGNWKMYKTISEAIELTNGLKRELFRLDAHEIDIVICPSFTALTEIAEIIIDSNILLGSQDAYWQDEGAFTGEISPVMLKDIGVKFVIIGHSERRAYFGETNASVNNKVKAVLRHNLTPIVCVGETLDQRKAGETFQILDDHVKNGLKDITDTDILKIVIAYEPVWAIGTGVNATSQQAQEAQKYIRDLFRKMYNNAVAEMVRIQYGGSVKPENITELMSEPDVDGALVGGGSLKIETFAEIVKKASQIKK